MMMNRSRREFLGAMGVAAGACVVRPSILRAMSAPSSPVAIGLCPEYNQQVMSVLGTMFDQLGGLKKLVNGKTVAIKLNMTGTPKMQLNGLPVEMTTWPHPEVIGATVALLGKAGAKRIRLLESPPVSDTLEQFMASANWKPQDFSSAAHLVEFENTDFLSSGKEYARFMVPGSPKMYAGYEMCPAYRDCDVMVSLAKLKEHRIAGVTLSMKSMFGSLPTTIYGMAAPVDEPSPSFVPGNRAGMVHSGMRVPPKSAPPAIDIASHEPGYRMPHVVPELISARPVHLAIIDGIYSMEGGELPNRPGQGTVSKPLHPGVLIAGFNPVCTDSVAVAVMGFDPMADRGQPPFELCDSMLKYAEELGLGTRDLTRIEVRGTPIAKARYPYQSVKQLTQASQA
jgi:uncharacterized protein (DUF362 family)